MLNFLQPNLTKKFWSFLSSLVIWTEFKLNLQIFVGDALNGYFVSGEDYFQLPKTPLEGSLLHLKKVLKSLASVEYFGQLSLYSFCWRMPKCLRIWTDMQREDFECLSECCVWHWQERVVNEEVNLPASSPHAVIRFFKSALETMLMGVSPQVVDRPTVQQA